MDENEYFKEKPVTKKTSKNRMLNGILPAKPVTPENIKSFVANVQKDIDGIGMGVMDNGIAYLTGRGLARICGLSLSAFQDIYDKWKPEQDDSAIGKYITKSLKDKGLYLDRLYTPILKDNVITYAFTEPICLIFLEYYTFEKPRDTAKKFYRQFVQLGFRSFIYQMVGYESTEINGNFYKQLYYERVSVLKNKVPAGYFSIFHELGGFTLDLINNDIPVNDKIIPDISVGTHWANYWKENKLDKKYSNSAKYPHYYPNLYPQHKSNPQEANCYPNEALGEFRNWFYRVYLVDKFPPYISNLICQNKILESCGNKVVQAFIPNKNTD